MMIFFDEPTNARLAGIEEIEGMPRDELIRQAVSVWSYLTTGERQVLGIHAMKMIIHREIGSRS